MDVEEMREFLRSHPRYHTLNHWNNSTSYAHNVKLPKLGLSRRCLARAYDVIESPDFQSDMLSLLESFSLSYGLQYQAGFNGRSGGYLVLYLGRKDPHTGGFIWTGQSLDQDEDFSSWGESELRDRVGLVKDFDALKDSIRELLVSYCSCRRLQRSLCLEEHGKRHMVQT